MGSQENLYIYLEGLHVYLKGLHVYLKGLPLKKGFQISWGQTNALLDWYVEVSKRQNDKKKKKIL